MPRWARWFLAVLVLGFLLAGIAMWRMHRHADEVLERHAAVVERELSGWIAGVDERPPLAPWPADRPASERIRDARLVYERMADAVETLPPEADALLGFADGDLRHELDEDEARELDAVLSTLAGVFDGLEDARYADHVSRDPSVMDGFLGEGGDFQSWLTVRDHVFAPDYARAIARDEDGEALRVVRILLLAGGDVARGGTMIGAMMGTVLQREALDRLYTLLARGRLGADALAALAHDLALLRPLDVGPQLEAIFRLEMLLVRRTLLLTAGDRDAAAGLGVDLQISWRHLFSPRIQTAEILEELDTLPLPCEDDEARSLRDTIRCYETAGTDPTTPAEVLQGMMLVVAPRAARVLALHAVKHHLAEVAVALARYRTVHGTWPATLEELVPTYLDALEACPLAQLPLGYANGRVWSGGGDGDDDGGRPLDEDAAWDADGDRVWDLTAEAARDAPGYER